MLGTPKACKPLWAGTTSAFHYDDTSPVAVNGMVYVGSSDTKFYAAPSAGSPSRKPPSSLPNPLQTLGVIDASIMPLSYIRWKGSVFIRG